MRFALSRRTIGLVRPAISNTSGVDVEVFLGDASREWFVASAIRRGAGVRTYMAFGFGFNKQKVLSAAEKYVQQGKLQNAIAEYDKILKNDTKDLTVSNTVGDL